MFFQRWCLFTFIALLIPLFTTGEIKTEQKTEQKTGHHLCFSNTSSLHICPPFNTSPPPFPFSTSPGCGHPSFPLTCSTPLSYLNLNNLNFTLLHYDNSTPPTLTLSPFYQPNLKKIQSCKYFTHFPSIPPHPINLTNTPFKISPSTCSRLSLLKPCTGPTLTFPNCTSCPWHCTLVRTPLSLLTDCQNHAKPISEQGCQSDVLGFLDKFLKFGIQVELNEEVLHDGYFSKCHDCVGNKKGVCGYELNDSKSSFLCLNNEKDDILMHTKRIKAITAVIILLCLLCFLGVAYMLFKNRKLSDNLSLLEDPTTLFLNQHRSLSLLPPVFTFEELEASTNKFDPKRKIGDGGFGSVFLGQLLDGRIVAVKFLHHHNISNKSFCNEILILSSIDHPNLVKLHGYCGDPRGLLLVYDYITNGTLADHLHGPTRKRGLLNWHTRVDIALQVAMAMEYLHFTVDPPVVHRDITSSNIFVDQNMRVRVGDFGLSRLLIHPDPHLSGELSGSSSGCVWTGPQGTPGYLDPDYHRSFRLTEKSDVYSFGVVLLELITGMKAVDQRREKREVTLVDMAVAKIQLGMLDEVVDPVLTDEGAGVTESVAAVAELAFRCVAADKDDRPDACEVVAELKRIWSKTRGLRGGNSNVVVPAVES